MPKSVEIQSIAGPRRVVIKFMVKVGVSVRRAGADLHVDITAHFPSYWRCPHCMRVGFMQLSGVRPSVRPIRPPLLRVDAVGPTGRKYRSIAAAVGRRSSTAHTSTACDRRMRAVPRCQLTQRAEHRLVYNVQATRSGRRLCSSCRLVGCFDCCCRCWRCCLCLRSVVVYNETRTATKLSLLPSSVFSAAERLQFTAKWLKKSLHPLNKNHSA